MDINDHLVLDVTYLSQFSRLATFRLLPYLYSWFTLYILLRSTKGTEHNNKNMMAEMVILFFLFLSDHKKVPSLMLLWIIIVSPFLSLSDYLLFDMIIMYHWMTDWMMNGINEPTWSKRKWSSPPGPPVIEPFSFPRVLEEGSRAKILCSVIKGDSPITIRWLKDGRHVGSSSSANSGVTISSLDEYSSAIVFPKVSLLNRGNYTCIASNSVASANFTAEAIVHGSYHEYYCRLEYSLFFLFHFLHLSNSCIQLYVSHDPCYIPFYSLLKSP